MSGFTADPSAGEFTRGMELLAGAVDDSGVSSRAAAVQDDYLMKLLAGRPSLASLNVQLVARHSATVPAPAQLAANPSNSLGGQQQAVAARNPSPAPSVPQQRVASSASVGPSAAARAALGAKRFAALRARLLQHQDVFLQQMFDLHRCARRQQQLVAVCDRPEAMTAALAAVMASSREASQQAGTREPSSAPATAAPATQMPPVEQTAAGQRASAPAVAQQQHPIAAQPRQAQYPYGSVAARFGGPGGMYEGFPGAPVAPPAFDPMAAWYAHHYGATAHPYAVAAAQLPPQHRTGSLPVMAATFSNAGGSAFGSAGAAYGGCAGYAAASRDPALPRCTASAGVAPQVPMAFDGRAVALSHGDRWWQDPAQVWMQPLLMLLWPVSIRCKSYRLLLRCMSLRLQHNRAIGLLLFCPTLVQSRVCATPSCIVRACSSVADGEGFNVQVFGPAGVPALVERALTLQQEQSGGHGGAVSTRRGNEAQSHLQAKCAPPSLCHFLRALAVINLDCEWPGLRLVNVVHDMIVATHTGSEQSLGCHAGPRR